jgi:hypothetical protein
MFDISFMKNKETTVIDIEKLTKEFMEQRLVLEIDKVKQGHRYGWNDDGVFTKLKLHEVIPAARAFIHRTVEVSPDRAAEYIAAFPDLLKVQPGAGKSLAAAIAGTFQQYLIERLATAPAVKEMILAQWADANLDQMADFAENFTKALAPYVAFPRCDWRDIGSVDDLRKSALVLARMESYAASEDEDKFADYIRQSEEWGEFIGYVADGDIDLAAVAPSKSGAPVI